MWFVTPLTRHDSNSPKPAISILPLYGSIDMPQRGDTVSDNVDSNAELKVKRQALLVVKKRCRGHTRGQRNHDDTGRDRKPEKAVDTAKEHKKKD